MPKSLRRAAFSSPNTNYGSSVIDVVGPGASTYLKFNLAGVAAGTAVKKATLRLYVDAVSKNGQFTIVALALASESEQQKRVGNRIRSPCLTTKHDRYEASVCSVEDP
jgi:hypothetical protein